LRGIGDELDTVIEQSKLSLAKVIDDFIDGFQRDYLDFINLGSFRDEEFNDLSRSQKIQQRLRQKHTAAKKAAKQAARDKLGNANAKAKKTASKRLGLDLYVWRTMLDDKVRASHEEREGVIYNWNAPPEGGHPSEDWGCRCVAAPFYKGENDDTKDARPRFQCD
jgi:SPP1 gp7 family putative phage head morphogenesis protein